MRVNIKNLIDDAQCYDTVRELIGQKEDSARFVIPSVLPDEVPMSKSLPGSAMSVSLRETLR